MHKSTIFFIIVISLLLLPSCSKDKKAAVLLSKNEYKLVWADEFEYTGKPDATKWAFEEGYKRNREKQYYTDHLKNARVENGRLILELHKEKIANKDFKGERPERKRWLHYIYDIDSTTYTSASLTTKNLAEWTYGKIEIKAGLPKGIGVWPAFWMLGANQKEVG